MTKILEVNNLKTEFKTKDGIVHAVNGVSFSLDERETLGVVGESGCGKSVSIMSMLRLIDCPPGKIVAGEVMYNGQDLLKLKEEELRRIRGNDISVVFQDPMTFFNPVMTIGDQVAETYLMHHKASKKEALERAQKYLELVGIPHAKQRLKSYPHEFSGGMRQRAMIAMALISEPKILIADEPTTALDVTIQAQIVELVKKLRDEIGMSIIWITHDLGLIAGLADRINVMYGGLIIETAPVKSLYSNPRHPYTIGLLGSLPRMNEKSYYRLTSIDGIPPVLMTEPDYCPFVNRCKFAVEKCKNQRPSLQPIDDNGHLCACWIDPETGKER